MTIRKAIKNHMEWAGIGRVFLALGFVIGLLLVIAWGVRKSGLERRIKSYGSREGQLNVEDTLYLDSKHRVVIIGRGEARYVLLLGVNGDTLLERYDEKEQKSIAGQTQKA